MFKKLKEKIKDILWNIRKRREQKKLQEKDPFIYK